MRILLLHQYFLEDDEGGGTRFNQMVKLWEEMGHQVTVVAGMVHYSSGKKKPEYRGKYIVRKELSPSVTIYRCFVSEAYNKNFIGRAWGYFSFVFSSMWAGLFRVKEKADIILISSPPLFLGISAYIIHKWKRIPFVFEIRDLWPESAVAAGVVKKGILYKMALKLERFLYKRAVLINVVTPAFRTALVEKKNIADSKILMIPNAADFDMSEELRNTIDPGVFRKDNDLPSNLLLIYVGAHGRANNLKMIVESAEALREEEVTFLLIGDGMEKKGLQQMTQEKGLTNVIFRDSMPKKEVVKYILASDIGISILVKSETFKTVYSNKTFDYMACSKPILMALDGISRDLVEEVQCGRYCDPGSSKEIVDGIRYYLENPHVINEEGSRGYEYALKNFDRRVLARKYAETLVSIVDVS